MFNQLNRWRAFEIIFLSFIFFYLFISFFLCIFFFIQTSVHSFLMMVLLIWHRFSMIVYSEHARLFTLFAFHLLVFTSYMLINYFRCIQNKEVIQSLIRGYSHQQQHQEQ